MPSGSRDCRSGSSSGQGLQKQLLKRQSCGGECELGVETAKGKGEKAGPCGGGRQTVIRPRRASAGLHRMAPVRITHRQKHLLNPKDWGFSYASATQSPKGAAQGTWCLQLQTVCCH